jgi:radical SAM superfamily enzyme YgiQ (UPF0313 family)
LARVTLLRPPTVASRKGYSIPSIPPLSAAYLAAALREAGHEVGLIDALAEDLGPMRPTAHPALVYQGLATEAILERIDPATQAVGVSCMFTLSWPHVRDIILAIGRRFPGLPVIVGGEHATAAWREVLATTPPVAAVALGEGEETLVDFAAWLDGRGRLEDIPGLAHRGLAPGSEPVRRPRLRDADSLPWPAWDLVPLETYFRHGLGFGVDRGRSLPVLATRGCPYQCTFCSSPRMWTTRYVMRKPGLVLDELAHWVERYGIEDADFIDLTAIVRKDWIMEFCAEKRRRGLGITWQLPTGTRSEALDREVLRELYATGCRNLTYAPESGSGRVLSAIKKKVVLPRLIESMREAAAAGISVKCNLILGFPQETRQDILRTLWLLLKAAWIGVDDAPMTMFTPYPGTELYEELRAKGKIKTMDEAYHSSLACYMDLSVSSRYCEAVGPWELNAYRVLGLAAFYAVSFLSRPRRLLRTALNLLRGRSEAVFEQRVLDWFKRRRLARERAGRATAAESPRTSRTVRTAEAPGA